MIDDAVLLKARSELTRLNGELRELHLEEERCKLKRSRLEGDKTRVQALVDMCELAQRLVGKPSEPANPSFHLEDVNGAKLVVVNKPIGAAAAAPGRQRHKPAGLPTMAQMVLAVLEREVDGMRPRDIAQAVRGTWWPDAPPAEVGATAWRLAGQGRLERSGGRYKLLNGHA
jgi:hypothetical protein